MRVSNLELIESEATANANASVVLGSLTLDGGAEVTTDGAGVDGLSLGNAGNAASLLLGGLVEPGDNLGTEHLLVPILAEVGVGQHVVVLHHFWFWK